MDHSTTLKVGDLATLHERISACKCCNPEKKIQLVQSYSPEEWLHGVHEKVDNLQHEEDDVGENAVT